MRSIIFQTGNCSDLQTFAERESGVQAGVGPTGSVYKDTNAFRLLYPFSTQEDAQAHANCLRTVGVKIALTDERGNH